MKNTPRNERPLAPQADPARGHSLGSITKSASRPFPNEDKILKYYLQSVARELAPHNRVRSCMRVTLPMKDTVDVWYSDTRKTGYYRNLMRCGQVWVCPVCAGSISARRNNEFQRIFSQTETLHIIMGDKVERTLVTPRYHLGLATFTISHRAGVSLQSVLRDLERAYHNFWSGRWAVNWKQHHHVLGTIRALEVTRGANGWHPHIHTLIIRQSANTPANVFDMELDIREHWSGCVSSIGATCDPIHGCDYRAADEKAAEYISKMGIVVSGKAVRWNAVSEATSYPVKMGRMGSASLFDLLALYAAGDVSAGEAWLEAIATLKGKRYLVPSAGLYEKLRAHEAHMLEDESLEEYADWSDICMANLTLDEWRTICRKDLRGQVIAMASLGDRRVFIDYLESIL